MVENECFRKHMETNIGFLIQLGSSFKIYKGFVYRRVNQKAD